MTVQTNRNLFATGHVNAGPLRLIAEARIGSSSVEALSRRLLETWRDAGAAGLAQVEGDWAFACHDRRNGSLVLGLAPLSELELFYRVDGRSAWFSSDFRTFVEDLPLEWELIGKALRFEAFPDTDTAGLYHGVRWVAGGTVVTIAGDETTRGNRFWRLPERGSFAGSTRQAGDALRQALDVAVARRLAACAGPKGSLLSAGRDSSAVTAIAARQLAASNQQLSAWTAASVPGEPEHGPYLIDEAPLAGATASQYPNIRHHILRPKAIDLGERLDAIHRCAAAPVLQPVAVGWCEPLWDAADAAGQSLLLCGDFGNYALSAGGPAFLADVRADKGGAAWLGVLLRTALAGPSEWRPLASALVRPWRGTGARANNPPLLRFARGDLREALRQLPRPEKDRRTYSDALRERIHHSSNSFALVHRGRNLEMTDPTRDRGVVELMHALGADLLAGPKGRRTIFDHAFADLLPRQILRPRGRGRQNADWHLYFCPQNLRRSLRDYGDRPAVRAQIDIDGLAEALNAWPDKRTLSGPTYDQFLWAVLPAFALASFLAVRSEN